jgi:hypothetical protein
MEQKSWIADIIDVNNLERGFVEHLANTSI